MADHLRSDNDIYEWPREVRHRWWTKITGNNQFLPFDFKIRFLRAERKLEAVLRICWSHGFAFWFLGFTVCYHDSKSMLPIAFDHHKILKIWIFSFFFDSLNCILDVLLCFFGNQEVLFWSFSLSRADCVGKRS